MASSPPKLRTVITANERWVGLMGNDQGEKRISHLSYCWFLVVLCRLLNLKRTFEEKYGEAPLLYAYAPGRVNLIGEFKYLIEVSAVQWIKKKKKKWYTFNGSPPNVSVFSTSSRGTGEHIDYCGYSVLPMAIEQNILAAMSHNNSGTISLSNTNPQYKWDTALF